MNTKQIPATNNESCDKYHATKHTCRCPDSVNRNGGSYKDNLGSNLCKHKAHKRQQAAIRAQLKKTMKPVDMSWINSWLKWPA